MRTRAKSLIPALAFLIVLWLIWSRLHIVFFVSIPWWGLLIVAIVLFLTVDHLLHRLFR